MNYLKGITLKFKTKYLNNNDEICDDKPIKLNYGDRHLDLDNEVPNNSSLINYDSLSGTLYKNELNFFDTPQSEITVFINYIAVMRRFFLSKRKLKRVILIQKLAFKEIGVAIESNENIDTLFVYTFFNKFAQIEMYMTTCETGIITELNYYNQTESIEIKIPLTFEGITFIFEQIFEDFYQFKMDELNIENATTDEKTLINSIMQFDTKQIEIDSMDIYDTINGILKTNLSVNSQETKEKINYILNNDLILNHISSKNDLTIINKIFDIVDSKITTPAVAKQFVLEELHAASHGNKQAKEFAETSGFDKSEYVDAMLSMNSFDEVDGKGEAQQTLLLLLMQYIGLSDRNKLADTKIKIVDMFMNKYKFGKYEILPFENKRFFLTNQRSSDLIIDLYENYLVLINKCSHKQSKFDKVKDNKFYSRTHGYIEMNPSTIFKYTKDKKNIEEFNIAKIETLTERNEFSHIYENDRAKEFLYMMEYTTKIETMLEKIGAKGRGLHGKISSVEDKLTDSIIKSLRRIASIRNKKMHQKGYSNYIFSNFEDDCKIVISYLDDKLSN